MKVLILSLGCVLLNFACCVEVDYAGMTYKRNLDFDELEKVQRKLERENEMLASQNSDDKEILGDGQGKDCSQVEENQDESESAGETKNKVLNVDKDSKNDDDVKNVFSDSQEEYSSQHEEEQDEPENADEDYFTKYQNLLTVLMQQCNINNLAVEDLTNENLTTFYGIVETFLNNKK